MSHLSKSKPLKILGVALFLFLYLPILGIVVQSFNSSRHGFRWEGWTLNWYFQLFQNQDIRSATWNSIILAVVSTLLAIPIGVGFAYALTRFRLRFRRSLETTMALPIYTPDIVLASGMLALFEIVRRYVPGLESGMPLMIASHVTLQIPFVAMVTRARLEGMDPRMEEAAHDLGATASQAFWFVTWPLMKPGVLSGSLLAFTLSLDDFIFSFFMGGPGDTTLPVYIYSSVKRGVTPEVNALSALLVSFTALCVVYALASNRSTTATIRGNQPEHTSK